jgi:hypothetical protein
MVDHPPQPRLPAEVKSSSALTVVIGQLTRATTIGAVFE